MKFGYEKGWLYDLVCLYKTTINCQLMILELIEGITDLGIKVISANTDGVTVWLPLSLEKEYEAVVDAWCKKYTFSVEYATYNLYVRTSVNDYIATYISNKPKEPKRKGDFRTEIDLTKGYGVPIVAKALNEYYLNNIPIEQTIYNKAGLYSIYDYCLTQNVNSGYETLIQYIGKDEDGVPIRRFDPIQHTIRYICTKSGIVLMKKEKVAKIDKKTGKLKAKKLISIAAKQYVTLFNTYFPVSNFDDYNLDYTFYIKSTQDIINNISLIKLKHIKKYGGKLFDNLELTL